MMSAKRVVTIVLCILGFGILMGVRYSLPSPLYRSLATGVAFAVLGVGINLSCGK